jgi:hypothetical protein
MVKVKGIISGFCGRKVKSEKRKLKSIGCWLLVVDHLLIAKG